MGRCAGGFRCPFSVINRLREGGDRTDRKHRFVSITDMDDFADDTGRVQVYHSDDPDSPHPIQSLATGFQNHYCSQQLPDGGLDSHRFEDLFSSVETVWPEALDARRLSPAVSFSI